MADLHDHSTKLPVVVTLGSDIRQLVRQAQAEGKTVGFVPTMGALHAGHASLVEAARQECDVVVASIFVNPTQFAPHEDLSQYPRTLEADLQILAQHRTDYVFAPEASEMYPAGFCTSVTVGGVSQPLEGISRPDHFRGVATVVLKLLNLVPADRAYFGQKDYQQSLVIRRMATDLNLPVQIKVCPIVRDHDGLALSSRNTYLTPQEREQALVLSQSLQIAQQLYAEGERDATTIALKMLHNIEQSGQVQLEYSVVADAETLEAVLKISRPVVALLAVRVGTTRLIDNAILGEA